MLLLGTCVPTKLPEDGALASITTGLRKKAAEVKHCAHFIGEFQKLLTLNLVLSKHILEFISPPGFLGKFIYLSIKELGRCVSTLEFTFI